MGKFDNIFIISDIDHTFLATDRTVPERNIKALEYFKSEGGRFTFATGRSHMSLLNAFPNVSDMLNAPGIVANGSYLYDYQTNEFISPMFLPKEYAVKALDFVLKHLPGTGVRMLTPGTTFYCSVNSYLEEEISQEWYQQLSRYISPEDFTGEECCKIVVRDHPDKLDELRAKMESVPDFKELELFKSEADYYEIQAKGSDKGRGVEIIRENCRKEGIEPVIYACGDYENDIPMMRVADVAVCPDNAHPDVVKISHMRLCHCNDGTIADLIERL